ncbi:MAG TPA: TonB-dependent receptor [Thermoanaerobaculia bacterium]|nr:TonB-dependent receptor [Thermoanaerobaculia bacterium]
MRQTRRREVGPLLPATIFGWACAVLLLAGAAAAQNTTSSIRGVVKDANGPVAGATVGAIDTESGFTRSVIADGRGHFALAGLPPGLYALAATSPGGATASQEIQLLLGQDVEVELSVAENTPFTQDVTVFGTGVQLLVETKSSEIATNVTPEQIETLPQGNRNFLSFAALAPGVRFTDNADEAGQKFRSGGADARQVNVFVDGLSYKNNVLQGGAFMQDSSRGNPFPQNAVQEFQVLTQNYKAEYEQAAAAVITAVTRSGGNDFRGDAFYLFQDKGMVTQDDFSKDRGDEKPNYKRKQWGLAIGGPIVKDKLHFFVSYEGQEQNRDATVFRGSNFALAPPSVQQYLGQYETGVLTTPFDSDLYFAKVNWQSAPGRELYATYHRRDEQEIRGFGGQRTRDGAESMEITTDAVVAKHQLVLGNWLNEATLSWQQLGWSPTALDDSTPRQNYIGILDVGGKDATQDFEQDRLGLRDDVSYFAEWHGTHAFKGGIAAAQLDYEVTKFTFENGLFEFRSDEQWLFPFQARIGFGDPTLEFDNTQVGLYLQDDWQVTPNLTLNLGLRWDYESNMINNDYRTPPELVAALQSGCRTYSQPVGGRNTWCIRDFLDLDRFTTDGNDRDARYDMIQPRLGFAWDVRGTGKTVVFGGWGKYYDRVILNDIFDEAYRQQFKIYSFCFSATGAPTPNCGVPALQWDPSYLSGDALRQLVANGQTPGPEVFLVDNELNPPRSDQWNLGVRQQLGRWLGSLTYAGVRTYNNLMYFFADLPPGTAFNDRFGGNVPIPGYARAFYTADVRKSWYDAIYLTLDRPMTSDGKWGFNFAYTYAKAKQTGTDNAGEGVSFGAFDYINSSSLFKFPGTNDERHRVVASGTYQLPANFQVSGLITLGSGVPFTIFDNSHDPFTVRWNEGRPEKKDFIIPDAWTYRSVDLRLEWQAPPIHDVAVTLLAEGFNIFDFDNNSNFDADVPRLPATNPNFGNPRTEFNTRRWQVGARVSF